jgi:hypothetical protein
MPDMLRADFGAEGRGASVEEALRGANSALARITDALAKAGVDPADMQTANVEIFPRYKRGGGISGYQVSHQLTVKIRQLDKAGATLSAAVDAGGNAARLFGVSFTIEDDSALLARLARRPSATQRRRRNSMGSRGDGRLVSVTETVRDARPYPTAQQLDSVAAAAPALPLEPGRQRLAVTVTVEWAFR